MSGRARKCVAIGRPLGGISISFVVDASQEVRYSKHGWEGKGRRTLTSCPLLPADFPGISSLRSSSSQPSRALGLRPPAQQSMTLAIFVLLLKLCSSPVVSQRVVVGGAFAVLLRAWRGSAEVVLKGSSSRARCRALCPSIQEHPAPLNRRFSIVSGAPPTMLAQSQEAALTGPFCRFAGRPSFSCATPLAALRLAALSISTKSRSR